MITCPGCQKTLPDWMKNCQFCGADTAKVVRPVAPPKVHRPMSTDAPGWVWGFYYGISIFYILVGLVDIGLGLGMADKEREMNVTTLILGGLHVVFGAGLAARVNFIRGIANVVCFLNMIFSALSVVTGFLSTLFLGPLGMLLLLMNIFTFASSAFMIFLIGETDKHAPSI